MREICMSGAMRGEGRGSLPAAPSPTLPSWRLKDFRFGVNRLALDLLRDRPHGLGPREAWDGSAGQDVLEDILPKDGRRRQGALEERPVTSRAEIA